MWPWFRRPWDRKFNKQLLVRALRSAITRLPRPVVGITTIPLVADLIGSVDVDRWIYYCVDDLAAWPGLDRGPLEYMERELVQKADYIVAVSKNLQQRIGNMGREAPILEHGVDVEHWTAKMSGEATSNCSIDAPSPWAVFWGLIDERLDNDWLLKTADALKVGTLILVGPVVSIDARVKAHPRIIFTGPISYRDLPEIARKARALIMPYGRMAATEAMQPLKLKEYMATGLPCIVRDLPSTTAWRDCVDVASNSDDFASLLRDRIGNGLPQSQCIARTRLLSESWTAKANEFESVIHEALASPKRFR
jgi:glycosyltransferase involved in cell wall biosynthesis